jgi:uncharacterized protein YcbX
MLRLFDDAAAGNCVEVRILLAQLGLRLMRVAALWRYPVKSLAGEPRTELEVAVDGVVGDRVVHIREAGGRVVTSRFRPQLLGLEGTLGPDGTPLIDGLPWHSPDALERIRAATAPDVELLAFSEPDHGQRFDVLPLTVLTDGMADAVGVDYRRFRPNVFVEGATGLEERSWAGSAIHVGTVVIGALRPRPRCVMTTFDPDTLVPDPSVLRRIVTDFGGTAALDCWVLQPGTIRVGDPVRIEPLPPGATAPRGNGSMRSS